jgi:hypothetical protein
MKAKTKLKKEANSQSYKKLRKEAICNETGKCTFCPIHGGENTSRKGKHGNKKPKYKNKRSK